MAAKVYRLRPKRHDSLAEALKLVLDVPIGLEQSSLDDLARARDQYRPTDEPWTYTMISNAQLRTVLKLINASERPALTLRVWTAAASHVRQDQDGVCEIMASRTRLAEDAETTPQEASRALSALAEMGALIRLRPGRYAINPHVGWNGDLARREAAAKESPQLRLVE